MITNERQYIVASAQAERFREALARLKDAPPSARVHARIRQAEIEGLQSQIDDLRRDLNAYKKLKTGNISVLRHTGLPGIAHALIRARIAEGLKQEDLAARLGVKAQQVQRYEATGTRCQPRTAPPGGRRPRPRMGAHRHTQEEGQDQDSASPAGALRSQVATTSAAGLSGRDARRDPPVVDRVTNARLSIRNGHTAGFSAPPADRPLVPVAGRHLSRWLIVLRICDRSPATAETNGDRLSLEQTGAGPTA